jgi:hypothetical protein
MKWRVENGMKASRHQVQGKRSDGEKVGMVLHVGAEPGASVIRPMGRLAWMASQAGREEGLGLVRLAGAKRAELAVLAGAAVTVVLRRAVTGVTCLASLRSMAPRLTVTTSVEFAGRWGFGPGQVVGGELGRRALVEVDEGGIYSW